MLLTGFEPFDGETLNPSLEAVRALAGARPQGVALDVLELPVDRFAAIATMLERLDPKPPDVVVMLGEAGGRAQVTPERVAINVDDFPIPDNVGNQPTGEPIVDGAPAGYFSTLPVREITARLHAAHIPAAISNTAGTYLCNRLFYAVMHHVATHAPATRAGFVHLPYLHEQVATKRVAPPSLARETQLAAVRIVVEAAAQA